MLCVVQNGALPFSLLTFIVAWMARELLYVFVYCEAVCNVRHITWGRRTYRLSNFGEQLKLNSDKSSGLLLPVWWNAFYCSYCYLYISLTCAWSWLESLLVENCPKVWFHATHHALICLLCNMQEHLYLFVVIHLFFISAVCIYVHLLISKLSLIHAVIEQMVISTLCLINFHLWLPVTYTWADFDNFWQNYCSQSNQSKDSLFSHLT